MPTIAQAQALWLKSGGNAGGMGRSSFTVKVKRSNDTISFDGNFPNAGTMEAMLSLYIGEQLTRAADNLDKANKATTGNLESSLKYKIINLPRGYRVQFLAADYYEYVDAGVQGVGPGNVNTTSKFKFKGDWVSKSHAAAIRKWIGNNRMVATATDVSRYGATRRESKAISPQQKEKSLAYAIAKASKRKGIKATNFWSDAFDKTFKDFAFQMSKALGEDIKISLKDFGKL